jgi:2-polyprenyl-6-hydroxyphenyl methylase / 3-demethylubiquinone-9 3-methyltransferase
MHKAKNVAMKAAPSIDPAEIAKFSALADDWWNPNGKFAPLHRFNPVRVCFIRDTAAAHFGRTERVGRDGRRPFEGLSLLDIGCGGGLLAEPMARLGFKVLGADASEKNIKIAGLHAKSAEVDVDYKTATAEDLAAEGQAFDVVLNMEVIEHVADLNGYVRACSKLVKPGGLMFVASLNKTLKSLLLAKIAAEYVLRWLPVGTHDWERFVPPGKLKALLEEYGFKILKMQGVVFDPLAWEWRLSADTDVNYMVVAGR